MKLGLAQTNIKWEDKKFNINIAEKFILEAKTKNVDLILFPEMSFTGFSFNVEKLGEDDDFTIDKIKLLSNKYDIAIGFGYIKKCFYENTLLGKNEYIVVYKNNIISNYTKIHPFSFSNEDKYFISGSTIVFSSIKDITFSTFICYDLRFPEIFQIASRKADLITVASNWPIERIDDFKLLLKARAIENQCYIAGINRIGNDPSLIYNGCSCIIDPFGKEVISIENSEILLVADIDKNLVLNHQKDFPLKADKKYNLYNKYNNLLY
ncbi:nitrilase-related carbon-nitrogen hydrolase [Clostridium senegalense]|uniref:nitrilase-related carbon-nitrogen hydrolase n=1 Tax=Clostridium senegalense TaxID=1465809 RepID=UPI001C111762|nr:nitrilase-related carbon-nitrogen hydrolase [Clostridium senegalense]MBU5226460.1 carbon-nitrogen family hydrolase [Clostridium senegalense]